MRIRHDFPYAITEEPHALITMPDGVRLSARIWRPEDAGPVPAILEFLPYRKRDGTIARDEFSCPWMAGHGYAYVRVDMRGNGESEGLMTDEYTPQELDDACQTIAWLREQPWCDGAVGMTGISWGGFNCLQVAALRPEGLKAVISVCSTVDRYADDIHYKGGCQLVENLGWAANMLAYSSRPPDPALVGEDRWLTLWRQRLENQPFHMEDWLGHQHRDAYWKHGSICEDYSAIEAAVLSVGGWSDGYRNTMAHLLRNIQAPVKAIAGPWNHKYPHYAGPGPAIGYLQEAKRWWDRYLKGQDTGVDNDPAYRAYLQHSQPPQRWYTHRDGHWIVEQTWPAEHIKPHTLHLTAAGLSGTAAPLEQSICSVADCGLESSEYFPFAFGDEMPGEQSHDDDRSLCIDGTALDQDWDIVGAPIIDLQLTPDQPTGQVCVRLCDLRPDGSSAMITWGVFNLCHHQSHETPQALVPGHSIRVRFALDQVAYRLPPGHRLRVAISTAYWPYIWPAPHKTQLHISSGTLQLPLRPAHGNQDECQFQAPEGSEPWQIDVLRAPSYQRQTRKCSDTGRTEVCITVDAGEQRDKAHGLVSGSTTQELWSIHPDDPLSARADIEWNKVGGRPGAMWSTRATSLMHCDQDTYYVTASLECWLNSESFFTRQWEMRFKRQLV